MRRLHLALIGLVACEGGEKATVDPWETPPDESEASIVEESEESDDSDRESDSDEETDAVVPRGPACVFRASSDLVVATISAPSVYAEFVVDDMDSDGLREVVFRDPIPRGGRGFPSYRVMGIVPSALWRRGDVLDQWTSWIEYESFFWNYRIGRSDLDGDGYVDLFGIDRDGVFATSSSIVGEQDENSPSWGWVFSDEGTYFPFDLRDVDADGGSEFVLGNRLASIENIYYDDNLAVWVFDAPTTPGEHHLDVATGVIESDANPSQFGREVRVADVDRDGIDDFIVADRIDRWRGRVSVYLGPLVGTRDAEDYDGAFEAVGRGSYGSYFGDPIEVGDANGDGWLDLLVGARYHGFPVAGDGGAFLFLGPLANGLRTTEDADLVVRGDTPLAQAGYVVRFLQDLDGDGGEELIVSASGWDDAPRNVVLCDATDTGYRDECSPFAEGRGAVGLFLGSRRGEVLMSDADQLVRGTEYRTTFGWSVMEIGDGTGDGWPELMVPNGSLNLLHIGSPCDGTAP